MSSFRPVQWNRGDILYSQALRHEEKLRNGDSMGGDPAPFYLYSLPKFDSMIFISILCDYHSI